MKIIQHNINKETIAEVISDSMIIEKAEDGIDLVGNMYYQGYDKVIVYEKNISPDFFDLQNKMAGEILQKFSNYRVRLAIVGDFSKFTKQSVKDFIFESNNGKLINFVTSKSEALEVLTA